MKYTILITLIFISSCIPTSKDLGGGYVLGYNNNTSDRVILIDNDLGGINLTYYEDSSKVKKYFRNEDWIIDSYVNNAVSDNKFVLIDQTPIDSICECNEKCLEEKYHNYNKLPTAKMCEEAIKNTRFICFI